MFKSNWQRTICIPRAFTKYINPIDPRIETCDLIVGLPGYVTTSPQILKNGANQFAVTARGDFLSFETGAPINIISATETINGVFISFTDGILVFETEYSPPLLSSQCFMITPQIIVERIIDTASGDKNSFKVPVGVSKLSIMAVGRGGAGAAIFGQAGVAAPGGGGATMAYINDMDVEGGETITIDFDENNSVRLMRDMDVLLNVPNGQNGNSLGDGAGGGAGGGPATTEVSELVFFSYPGGKGGDVTINSGGTGGGGGAATGGFAGNGEFDNSGKGGNGNSPSFESLNGSNGKIGGGGGAGGYYVLAGGGGGIGIPLPVTSTFVFDTSTVYPGGTFSTLDYIANGGTGGNGGNPGQNTTIGGWGGRYGGGGGGNNTGGYPPQGGPPVVVFRYIVNSLF